MYRPRPTHPLPGLDPHGIKLYAISADGAAVDPAAFWPRFEEVKSALPVDWATTPAFAIFHRGAASLYLVVAWWQNDNELFTSVSVRETDGWVEDPQRYSFCLWDLEVIWHERNSYVTHLYSGSPDLEAYRRDFGAARP